MKNDYQGYDFIYQEFIIKRLALAVYDHIFKTKQK